MQIRERKLNRYGAIDYSLPGFYFITICIAEHEKYFGTITNKKMYFNKYGGLANVYLQMIPNYYQNVVVDCFVVMPNHIHAIIQIKPPSSIAIRVGTEFNSVPTNPDATNPDATNPGATNLTARTKQTRNYGLLSKIVKSFKHDFTKTIKCLYKNHEFKWQRSFHDHWIRNEIGLTNIRSYIRRNPEKWNSDRNNDAHRRDKI